MSMNHLLYTRAIAERRHKILRQSGQLFHMRLQVHSGSQTSISVVRSLWQRNEITLRSSGLWRHVALWLDAKYSADTDVWNVGIVIINLQVVAAREISTWRSQNLTTDKTFRSGDKMCVRY